MPENALRDRLDQFVDFPKFTKIRRAGQRLQLPGAVLQSPQGPQSPTNSPYLPPLDKGICLSRPLPRPSIRRQECTLGRARKPAGGVPGPSPGQVQTCLRLALRTVSEVRTLGGPAAVTEAEAECDIPGSGVAVVPAPGKPGGGSGQGPGLVLVWSINLRVLTQPLLPGPLSVRALGCPDRARIKPRWM